MNIQFMTAEKNGIPTGEFDYKGNERYTYMPDWEEMIANASCEEEAEAIREAEVVIGSKGLHCEIVFTVFANGRNPDTGRTEKVWQVYQHPWYRTFDGVYDTKEQMLEEIKKHIESVQ